MEASASRVPDVETKPNQAPSKPDEKQRQNYTAFDRDLIKAQQRKSEITFFLVSNIPGTDEVRGMYVLFATPESIDKFMIKVKSGGRAIWLAKQFILAVEMKGKV